MIEDTYVMRSNRPILQKALELENVKHQGPWRNAPCIYKSLFSLHIYFLIGNHFYLLYTAVTAAPNYKPHTSALRQHQPRLQLLSEFQFMEQESSSPQ